MDTYNSPFQCNLTNRNAIMVAAAMLTAPFSVSAGTAGITALPTNYSFRSVNPLEISVVEQETKTPTFSEKLNLFISRYNLGKDQLSTIMNVSRPALYSWLKSESFPNEGNSHRLESLITLLDAAIPSNFSANLGPFLRKRLDSKSKLVLDQLSGTTLDTEKTSDILKSVVLRLKDIDKSKRLNSISKSIDPLS